MRILILIPLLLLNVAGLLGAAESSPPRVLVVVTSHGQMGDTGKPTGYWLAEVAHPWVRFHDAGFELTVASPGGGEAPMDPRSRNLEDAENARFWNELGGEAILAATTPLSEIDPAGFDAIYFAGGHGTMWDFPHQPEIQRLVRALHQRDAVIAAVCHGPAAFVGLTLEDGSSLVEGRELTAFSNSEEDAVDLTDAVPFLLCDRLRELGATVEVVPDWEQQVVLDGTLITGQNPGSAGATADAIIAALRQSAE